MTSIAIESNDRLSHPKQPGRVKKQKRVKADRTRYTVLGSQNFICQKCISGSFNPSALQNCVLLSCRSLYFTFGFLVGALFLISLYPARWQPTVNMAMRKAAPPIPLILEMCCG